jgi:hypothetical protein
VLQGGSVREGNGKDKNVWGYMVLNAKGERVICWGREKELSIKEEREREREKGDK